MFPSSTAVNQSLQAQLCAWCRTRKHLVIQFKFPWKATVGRAGWC